MHVKQLIEILSKLEPTAKVDIVIESDEIIADIVHIEDIVSAEHCVNNTGLVFIHCKVNEEWSVIE